MVSLLRQDGLQKEKDTVLFIVMIPLFSNGVSRGGLVGRGTVVLHQQMSMTNSHQLDKEWYTGF